MASILNFPITVEGTVIDLNPDNPTPVTLAVDETGLAAYVRGDGSVTPVGYTATPVKGVDIGTEGLQIHLLRVLLRMGDALHGTRNAELFDLYCTTNTAAREIAIAASRTTHRPSAVISVKIPGTRNMLHIEFGFAAGGRVAIKFTNSDRTPRTPLNYYLGDLRLTGIMASHLVDVLNGLDDRAMQHPGMPSDEASDTFRNAIVVLRPSWNHTRLATHTFRTPPLAGVTLTGEQARLMCGRNRAGYNTWAPPADLRGATVIAADDDRRPFLSFYLGDRIDGATFIGCSISMHDLRGKCVIFERCNFTELCHTVLRSPVMRDCEFGRTLLESLTINGLTIEGTCEIHDPAVWGLTIDGKAVDDLQTLVDQVMTPDADNVEAGNVDKDVDGNGDGTAKIAFELTVGAEWVREEIRDAYVNGGNPRDMTDEEVAALTALPDDVIGHALYHCIDDHVWAALDGLRSNVIDMLRRRVDPAD